MQSPANQWRGLYRAEQTCSVIVAGLALMLILVLPGNAAGQVPEGCVGTQVRAEDNLALAVQNGVEGETICISGHHRLQTALVPKQGMTLWGVDGAVLDGAKVLTSHVLRNGRYVFPNQFQNSTKQSGDQCRNYPRNCYNDGVFLDGISLFHVPKTQLKPGRYFFDYTNNQILLADNPAGHTVELTQAKNLIKSDASGVTVRDLIVENAAAWGIVAEGADWRILNVESRWNHTVGVNTPGENFLISGGRYHHNGQYGFNGNGGDSGVIDGVESHHNNYLRFGKNLGIGGCWAAGEAKWVQTTNLTIRNSYVHDGYCNGFWLDINNQNPIVENNRFERNLGAGLLFEITYGGVITGNTFTDNARFNLEIASSSDIAVYGNTFTGGKDIKLYQQAKGGVPRSSPCPAWDPAPCSHLAVRNTVHTNTVQCGSVTCFMASSQGVDGFYENNSIDFNSYFVDAVGMNQWRLENLDVPVESWRARGYDTNGFVFTPSTSGSP
jgi:Right handed beta helix region